MFYPAGEPLNQFYKVAHSCSPIAKELLSFMEYCIKSLKKIDDDVSIKINILKDNIMNSVDIYPSKHDRLKYANKVCFILIKYINLFIKYQSLRFNYLCQAKTMINEFISIISEYYKQNIPIQIQFSDFLSSVFEDIDEQIPRLEFKLKSLFNYVKNLPVIERSQVITDSDLFVEMKKLSEEVDTENDYIRQNSFDIMFETFIESNQDLLNNFLLAINSIKPKVYDNFQENNNDKSIQLYNDLIDKNSPDDMILNNFSYFTNLLVSKIPPKSNSNINLKLNYDNINDKNESDKDDSSFQINTFSNLIGKVYSLITHSTHVDHRMFIILYCAGLRFLCNKYYIIHHNEWLENINEDYINNCQRVLNQTPHELKITDGIFPENFYNMNFNEILLGDNFQIAIKKMMSIQFLLCPIDILNELQESFAATLKAVNASSNPDSIQNILSFDDFFSTILPVFSSAQIMSPKAFSSFLLFFKNLPKSNSFESTSISAVAFSGFLRNEIH